MAGVFATMAYASQAKFAITAADARWLSRHGASMRPPNMIRHWRQKRGLTLQALASIAGMDYTLIQKLETGKLRLKLDQMESLAKALTIPVQELIAPRTVQLVGFIGNGGEVVYLDDHSKGGGLEEVEAPPGCDPETVALEVRGESNYPVYRDGYLIFYNRGQQDDPARCIGEDSVVRLADGRTMLKSVARGTNGLFTLNSYSAPPIHDVEITWAAPVDFVDRRRRRSPAEQLTKRTKVTAPPETI